MRKVFFRADAGPSIGFGHFIRSLALADMLKSNFDCTFFTANPSPFQIREMYKVCQYVSIREDMKMDDFVESLEGDEIVVLDNYFFTTDYQRKIKAKGCKLVCIDDLHDKHYVADIVINQGVTDASLYSTEPETKLCLGLKWALLRREFLSSSRPVKSPNSWFVSFGGTDFKNLTAKFSERLNASPLIKRITVVVGDAYQYGESLAGMKKVTLKRNLSSSQMHDEMMKAEYAVLSASTVCLEALACQCKISAGFYVDNQRDFYTMMANDGYIHPLGDLNITDGGNFIEKMQALPTPCVEELQQTPERYINLFKNL